MIDPKEVAKQLNAVDWMERKHFIEDLKQATDFCWECFMEYDRVRFCHCKNDE